MKLKIALVGPHDTELEKIFSAEGYSAVVWSEKEAAARARQSPSTVDVLVFDARGQSALPPSLELFRRDHPTLPAALVLSALDPGLMLQAMRAGITECLAEPLTGQDLSAALKRLHRSAVPVRRGSIFAFLGAKGGVGATTAAVNVAAALQGIEAPVLVVDLHMTHGDAAVFLGAEPRFSVVDALENMQRLDAAFFQGLVAQTKGAPDLLASSDRTFITPNATYNVRQLVEFAALQYKYVILDVPRSDTVAMDALDSANVVVLVANQELATVRNAARMAEALRNRYGKDRIVTLLNRYDAEGEIGQDDVERTTGIPVKATIPNDYRLALQALNRGRPLLLDNHSRLASSYTKFAHDLAGKVRAPAGEEQAPGFLGRLLGKRS